MTQLPSANKSIADISDQLKIMTIKKEVSFLRKTFLIIAK